jgi:hypothetical protein
VAQKQETAESRDYSDVIDLTDTVEIESMPEIDPEETSWLPTCFDCGPTVKEAKDEDMNREQPEVEEREESPEPAKAEESLEPRSLRRY